MTFILIPRRSSVLTVLYPPVYHDLTDMVIRVGEVVAVVDPADEDGALMFAKVEQFIRVKV